MIVEIVVVVFCLSMMLSVPLALVARTIIHFWCRQNIIRRLKEAENIVFNLDISRPEVLAFIDNKCKVLWDLEGFDSVISLIESGHRERASVKLFDMWFMIHETGVVNYKE
jgi:hypothetical protein